MVAGPVRWVVVLYSNDCVEICLDGVTLIILEEWLSYRGGRLNRFDCSSNCF